ncbi:Ribonuclease BN, tRNA processing enzyme [Paenibacillus algorifonticola]|uniref:Ribonuclease BN, tRNA processing enzyme n=1 Tax=Paenibacillus algorifonticola TaxID=684063 RepID=A0A1I2EK06_9BACL|nr:MBL fold metallo-hydrolase [Paenibacillus algorifonticola]SFE93434.1 Ribonuclease BN, tRNA processing enzyme [Paenibacillus algorifonticola]
MDVKILGYWGGYPPAGGATAGYLVSTDEGQILLDCGSGVMSRLAAHTTVEHLSGVILSHLHFDHMADIGILQYAAAGARRNGRMDDKLAIYAPAEPANMLENLYSEHTIVKRIDSLASIQLAGANIEFVPVKHTIPCYAVKITYQGKVLVYSGDTSYCESLISIAKDADILLCEATICEGSRHTTGHGHMNAAEAGSIAEKANVKQLVLVHLPGDGDFEFMRRAASEAFGGPVALPQMSAMYVV